MDFPECKKLKHAFDICSEVRKKVIWESLLRGQLPPKEGDCEAAFSDYRDCFSEYLEKFILAKQREKERSKGA